MPRIAVEPGQLSSAAATQADVAGALAEAAGVLQNAAANAAAAAGNGGAPATIAGWGDGWSAALTALGSVAQGTSGNVAAAGQAYTETDSCAVPAGGL